MNVMKSMLGAMIMHWRCFLEHIIHVTSPGVFAIICWALGRKDKEQPSLTQSALIWNQVPISLNYCTTPLPRYSRLTNHIIYTPCLALSITCK